MEKVKNTVSKNNIIKPESIIVEEALLEIQTEVNNISKKHNLSFFTLKIILKELLGAVERGEAEQNNQYYESLKEKNNE